MPSKNIYCVYLTVYRGNKLPPFYIGKTNLAKIENGYRGSVSSKELKKIWLSELETNDHLFKTKIIKTFDNNIDSSNYEIKLLRFFRAHRNPMYMNRNIPGVSYNLSAALRDKTHHFNSSDFQSKLNHDRIRKGTHQFKNKEWQREMCMRAKLKDGWSERQSLITSSLNKSRVLQGIHNFQDGTKVSNFAKEMNSRNNVQILRKLVQEEKILLGQNWYRKSDLWINSKIEEINNRRAHESLIPPI